ncbi:MAG: sulfite exporter TauE/SafE family protein [Dehalococcoidia bacterium]|nr:sulfite exporter TauE/SafE family protein [Dehalococcoidia bacterium]
MALELLGLAALGLVVGAYGTMIGAGGGFILVPLLLLLYPSYGPEELTAVSLAVVFANATSGSVAYARRRRIDYVTGLLFAVSSAPGVLAGAVVVHFVPERAFTTLFGAMLLALAFVSVRAGGSRAIRRPRAGPGVLVRTVVDPEGRTYRYAYDIRQGVALSAGVGFISSLFGIGGGVIHVPAMIILLHIPVSFAVATSHFVLAFMAGGGSVVHLADGSLAGEQIVRALALAAGAIPGAQAGALLAHRIKGRNVLLLLAVAIAVLGLRLLVKGLAGL